MSHAVAAPAPRGSVLGAVVLLGGTAFSGFLFLGMLPSTVSALVSPPKYEIASGVFYNALFGVAFVALVRRVVRWDLVWPTGWQLTANVLDGFARGWGAGVCVLSARVIGEAIQNGGGRNSNGSFVADVFFFLLVTLLVSIPGLAALALARRVA